MAHFLSLRSADSCCSIPRVCTSCCFSYVSTLAFFALQLVNTCMIPVTLQSPFPPFRHIMHTSLSHLLSLIGLDLYSFRLRVVPVGLLNNLDPESSMSYFIFASTFQIGPWSGRHEDDRIVATSLIPCTFLVLPVSPLLFVLVATSLIYTLAFHRWHLASGCSGMHLGLTLPPPY